MAATVDGQSTNVAALLEAGLPLTDEQFELIYRRYKGILVHYASRASDPEAVAQMALLDGYRAMNRFEGRNEAAFLAYLKRAAYGHMVDDYNLRTPTPTDLEPQDVMDDLSVDFVDRMWLRQLVTELPPEQRAVIEHRFFDDLDGQQTAERLGKDPNAVYQLQHRAVRRLRRMIFAGVFVVLGIAAVLAIRQAIDSTGSVDSTPVDRSGNPTTTLVEPPVRPPTTPSPDESLTDDTVGLDGQPVPARQVATGDVDAGPQTTTADEVGETVTDTAGQSPTTTVTTSPTTSTAETSAPTTSSPTGRNVPQATVVPVAATPLNHCAPQQISATMSTFKLYNPASSRSLATAFVPPSALRFVNGDGQVIHLVDTSGPMVTGVAANAHGWMGAGDSSGTYSSYDEAPRPTYWGILATFAATDGWQSIEYRDQATGAWRTVPSCQ